MSNEYHTMRLVLINKQKRAYCMLGLINRNFIDLKYEDTFVTLSKSLASCHLQYANSVWNPHRKRQIEKSGKS